MGRSQNTFIKREKEKKRLQKRKEKREKMEERKAQAPDTPKEMIAYVDEFGNITDTPPDPLAKKKEVKAANIELGIPKKEKEDPNAERRGRVSFFNDSKGYGFINQDGTQERFFVHATGLKEPIQEGDKVCFQVEKGLKGMNAVSVKVLG